MSVYVTMAKRKNLCSQCEKDIEKGMLVANNRYGRHVHFPECYINDKKQEIEYLKQKIAKAEKLDYVVI